MTGEQKREEVAIEQLGQDPDGLGGSFVVVEEVVPFTPPPPRTLNEFTKKSNKEGGVAEGGVCVNNETQQRLMIKQAPTVARTICEVLTSRTRRLINPEHLGSIAESFFIIDPSADESKQAQGKNIWVGSIFLGQKEVKQADEKPEANYPDEEENEVDEKSAESAVNLFNAFRAREHYFSVTDEHKTESDPLSPTSKAPPLSVEEKDEDDDEYDGNDEEFFQNYLKYREKCPTTYRFDIKKGSVRNESLPGFDYRLKLKSRNYNDRLKPGKMYLYLVDDEQYGEKIECAFLTKKGIPKRLNLTGMFGVNEGNVVDILKLADPEKASLENRERISNNVNYILKSDEIFKQESYNLRCSDEVYNMLYHSEYMDLWQDAYYAYNFAPQYEPMRKKLGGYIKVPNARPRMVGTINKHPIVDIIKSGRYDVEGEIGLPEHAADSDFTMDRDRHPANYGAMPIPGNPSKKKVGAIDFDWGCWRLDDKVHFLEYQSPIGIYPFTRPTEHGREMPIEVLICDKFAEQQKKIGNFPTAQLNQMVEQFVGELRQYFQLGPLVAFADHIAAPLTVPGDRAQVLYDISQHLKTMYRARQQLARQLYFEVKLSLSFIKIDGRFNYDPKRYDELNKIIADNKAYFQEYLDHPEKQLKFWREDQDNEIFFDEENDDLNFLVRARAERICGVPDEECMVVRDQSVFHKIFNAGKLQRFAKDRGLTYLFKTMFGFPNNTNPKYNIPEFILVGFGVVTFAKNLIKLVTEYLPAELEDISRKQLEKNTQIINHRGTQDIVYSSQAKRLAKISQFIFAGCYYAFKGIKLLGMRLTSPVTSFKQAYRFGERHSPAAAMVCGVASAVVSTSLSALVGLALSPVIAAVLAAAATTAVGSVVVSAFSAMASFMMAVPGIGSAVTALGSLAGGSIGPALGAFQATVITPVRSGIKALIKWASKGRTVKQSVARISDSDEVQALPDQQQRMNRGALHRRPSTPDSNASSTPPLSPTSPLSPSQTVVETRAQHHSFQLMAVLRRKNFKQVENVQTGDIHTYYALHGTTIGYQPKEVQQSNANQAPAASAHKNY